MADTGDQCRRPRPSPDSGACVALLPRARETTRRLQAPGRDSCSHREAGEEIFSFFSGGEGWEGATPGRTTAGALPHALRSSLTYVSPYIPTLGGRLDSVVRRPYDRQSHWSLRGLALAVSSKIMHQETYPLDSHPGFRREGLHLPARFVLALPQGSRGLRPPFPQGLAR